MAFQGQTVDGPIDAYIQAQEGLIQRCDDVFLAPGAVAIQGDTAFIEWTMGLKIKGMEFLYPGTTRLRLNAAEALLEKAGLAVDRAVAELEIPHLYVEPEGGEVVH